LNARSETLAEKPAFRDALRLLRCLVPVDGFYEWKSEGKSKTPYLFSFDDERPFALAGLWSSWSGPMGVVDTYAIVTTEANALLRTLHDRMPILLHPSSYDEWLDPARGTVDLDALRMPRDWPGLSMRPVSRRLGSVKHDDASLLVADSDEEAVTATTTTTQKKTPKKTRPAQGSLF
jgi:putative SOS response-associated peptidase YedK